MHFFLILISLIQALTVSPFTSISQAPQLPVRHPVGISKPAFSAEENQSSPSETNVSLLFGHIIMKHLFQRVMIGFLLRKKQV